MHDSNSHIITKTDIKWIVTLFGTAIGAGLLYLPVQAGQSGLWALLTVLFLAFPLTFFSHRNMANIIIKSEKYGIANVFTHNLGKIFGIIFIILYFFAIFLNMPMYSIGLNNELGDFLGMAPQAFCPVYVASKYAINGYIRSWAVSMSSLIRNHVFTGAKKYTV